MIGEIIPSQFHRDAAAAYCGMSASHFDEHVGEGVLPLRFGKRYLWDIETLDRRLDQQSGVVQAGAGKSIEELLNGNPGARR
jgi:hypothetical protein